MRRAARVSVTPQLAFGIFIMAAGVLLTLDSLNVVDAARSMRLWPAALVLLGATMWARRRDAHARFWGSVWIFLGSWLLLNTLGLVRIGLWELFWPLVLVLVGVKLVKHAVRDGQKFSPAPANGGTTLFAVLGESKRSSNDQPFLGGQMTAIMGGCQLDLRQAVMAPGEEASIDVFALMGGLEIRVPVRWAVAPDVVPILGGVEDKRLQMPAEPPGADRYDMAPRLLLRGHVVMGGLTIKN